MVVNIRFVEVAETPPADSPLRNGEIQDKEEGDSGIDANSQGSCSSNDVKAKEKRKDKKKKKSSSSKSTSNRDIQSASSNSASSSRNSDSKEMERRSAEKHHDSSSGRTSKSNNPSARKGLVFEVTRNPAERDDFEATGNETYVSSKNKKAHR